MPQGYEAVWCPGLNDDFDEEKSLLVAYDWLLRTERRFGRKAVIVMYAAQMRNNNPTLQNAPREIISRRSTRPNGAGPILCIYPDPRTLEYAEELARNTALCVVGGSLFDVATWIRRTNAKCLLDGYAVAAPIALAPEMAKSLDSMLFFGGHNGFLGGGEKEDAVRRLRAMATRPDAPSRRALEEYLRASGKTDADGAERAGKWYEEVREGKGHRDYRGRAIR
jgi:hypothetical protein